MLRINIIGAGRVGRTLLHLLGSQVQHVSSATHASAQKAVWETGHGMAVAPDRMAPADLWCLTVPDAQITHAADALAGRDVPPSVAVHWSGFHTANIMAPLRKKGWRLASAHPNLSFADPHAAAASFAGTPCGLEGDSDALEVIDQVLVGLHAKTFRIPAEKKPLYHAAAVFSNNFATVLQAVAREAWQAAEVPDQIAAQLNASLLTATAENVNALGPQAALTGPAARGDSAVVAAEAKAVTGWRPQAGQLYTELSDMAHRLKTTGST
ncbi:MAG: Rossmann-like and DUF2520 domain-containing protein [Paracoccaceae bacterium]